MTKIIFYLGGFFVDSVAAIPVKKSKIAIDEYVRVRRIRSNGGMGNWNPIFGGINLNIEEYSVDIAKSEISDYNYR